MGQYIHYALCSIASPFKAIIQPKTDTLSSHHTTRRTECTQKTRYAEENLFKQHRIIHKNEKNTKIIL